MKLARTISVSLAALLFAAGIAAAQNYDQELEQSVAQARETMEAMGEFVKDVTFDENDIQEMIKHWDDITSLGNEDGSEVVFEGEGEVVYEDEEEEEVIDFEALLADPEYRDWAKSRNLDPDTWMKKVMRIQVMMMKDAMAAGSMAGRAQMEAQLAEIESQRAQMGEEAYQQVKQAMEAGAAALEGVGSAYSNLPEPMASEKALIERYREQIMNLE